MKVRKKVLALLLAAVTTLSMGVTAFATGGTGETTYTDQTTVTIKKEYVAANADTTSPAETFTLVQVGDGKVTDGDAASAPALGTITGAAFEAGDASTDGTVKNITITLPAYDRVGVYEYTLQEVAGTTAGVTYYGNTIRLVVTVMQGADGKIRVAGVHTETEGEKKSDTFTNTYSAGTLNVSKTVEGNMGDHDKYFTFTVTLTGEEGKTYAESYAVTGGSNQSNPQTITIGTPATFYLKDGETISIANLPYNVSYAVTEAEANTNGYTTTPDGDTGTINAVSQTASFTNSKTGEVDTGITLDTLPYILVFGLVMIAAVVMIVRRRRVED
ncbi:MAG TPA: hypothetical protein H9744_02450 [Candidatus Eisenbergiella stercoravium]|nr:hypothetical protein [Candidatus Eisenbergiella stercoravium]